MNRYFINSQLKRSSIILIGMMLIFFIIIFFILNIQYDQLKEDYINSFGGMVSTINEEDPRLAQEVISLLTKGASRQEAAKGAKILEEYGLQKDLENHLFPYINHTYQSNNFLFLSLMGIMGLLLFLFNYYQHAYFYRRIRSITSGAQNIVEGQYDTIIQEDQEGDFSKLATAFNSMANIIRTQLEKLQKDKGFLADLLADISHQLKTPLSSLILYNDIMIDKELSREQQLTFLDSNQRQLDRMQWLIQSLLKLAKLDARAIQFSKEEQSLNRTIEETIEMVENQSQEKDIMICFHPKHEMILEHDSYWLKEALINILVNSIQHSSVGEEITIQLMENPIYKRIVIKDHGEGIHEEDLPNIFKRFYKAKTSQKSDSVGIGLALSKAIIEGHSGMIEAQSELGVGTRFIITFLKY